MNESDQAIIDAFKKIKGLGKKEVPMETVIFATGMTPQRVHSRLNSLSKYGFVRRKRKKPVFYWEIV